MESKLIAWLIAQQRGRRSVRVGIGDDLAVLKWRRRELLLVGTDQVMDGVHFRSDIHSPRAIGRKAMNRSLSDCAAMACVPVAAVVSAALPRGCGMNYAKSLYVGLRDAANKLHCEVVGGDTAAWKGKLVISVTVLGRSARTKPITRDGARDGDWVFVTGPLGGSILGRHMTFEPRVRLAQNLAQRKWRVSAMLDLSDGVAIDLRRICDASGVGAVIDAGAVPVHKDVSKLRRDGRSPLHHALSDGEDYELLFTSPLGTVARATRIGRIVSRRGAWIETNGKRTKLAQGGWDHSL
ncbi:MAG: thiamine-phosphate kinase [Tepidisphaeraceae bacterium]